jgi:hypothetical protein
MFGIIQVLEGPSGAHRKHIQRKGKTRMDTNSSNGSDIVPSDTIQLDKIQIHNLKLHFIQLEADLYEYAELLDDTVDGNMVVRISEPLLKSCLTHEDMLQLGRLQRILQNLRRMQASIDTDYQRIVEAIGTSLCSYADACPNVSSI